MRVLITVAMCMFSIAVLSQHSDDYLREEYRRSGASEVFCDTLYCPWESKSTIYAKNTRVGTIFKSDNYPGFYHRPPSTRFYLEYPASGAGADRDRMCFVDRVY